MLPPSFFRQGGATLGKSSRGRFGHRQGSLGGARGGQGGAGGAGGKEGKAVGVRKGEVWVVRKARQSRASQSRYEGLDRGGKAGHRSQGTA